MHIFYSPYPSHPLNPHHQTEELANALTHFLGFMLALIGFFFLLKRAFQTDHAYSFFACLVYALSVSLTFLVSAIYHFSTSPRYRYFFHVCDHMAIYLMIAGTYTPLTLLSLHGWWSVSLFALIWTLTLIGFIFKLFFIERFNLLSTLTYLLMGWTGIIAIVPIIESLSVRGLFWIILGGGFYTLGVIFYLMRTIRYSHTIWHLFVIAGAICHFICIYEYVL